MPIVSLQKKETSTLILYSFLMISHSHLFYVFSVLNLSQNQFPLSHLKDIGDVFYQVHH